MTNVNGATEIDTRRSGRVGAADRLKRLYIIALGLIALLTIVSQLVIQRALMTQESDALVINVAGRQRMLSQELAKTALAVDEVLDHCYDEQTESFPDCDELVVRLANLGGALDLWTRSHAGLRHGDAELDLPGANSPEVTALFETVEPHYHAMREAVMELLEYDPKARSASVDQRVSQVLIPKIMKHEGFFLVGMNEIVLVYEAQARQRASGLKQTALILMSVILLVLLLEAVLVFAPAARVIRRQFTQLRQSEEWLSTTLKSIGDAVIATDATGRVKFMNVVAEELTGWTHDDAAGKPVGEVFVIVKEATGEPAENPITKVLQEGVTVGLANHTALISKNGTRRPIDDSGAPIRDEQGQVLGAVLCFRDITERRRAEEERSRLATAIEQVVEGVTITDIAGTIQYVNSAFERMTGYASGEAVGKNMRILKSGKQDEAFYKHVWGTIKSGEVWRGSFINRRKDGTLYDEEGTISPVRDANGKIINFVAVKYNVTDRRRAEEAVRLAQQELFEQQQREKEHVESELAKVRDELIRKTRLAAIGQVSASIAHELRNPLGSIRNAAYLLQRRIPSGEDKGARYVEIISQEVNRADTTINNLMEMSRPKDPAKLETDLGEMVKDGSAQAGIPADVRLRMVLKPDPFVILVDPSQFQQVLGNLFTNAVQAMNGSGEIVVDVKHGDDYYDEIVVRDCGPGIPAGDRKNLFEPLFSTKAKGTGLGLTICRQIIQQHGGAIDLIEPDGEGAGAAFRIQLPRRRPPGEFVRKGRRYHDASYKDGHQRLDSDCG